MNTTVPGCHFLPVLAISLVSVSEAQPIRTQDVAKAGPDYQVQGEYIGSLRRDGDPEMFGVQVIARGKGAFDAVGLQGGLPGAGWDLSEKLAFKGRTEEGGKTILAGEGKAEGQTVTIRDGSLRITNAAGDVVGKLERVVRKSPTLGQKPPEGALVLFDGSTTEHFVTARKKPVEITKDGFLRLPRGSGGLFTAKPFGDCQFHVEFRLPFEPEGRGQGRSNSGCYLQSRYEVQILDSFGLKGRENECGGVYSSRKDPAANMCFPPLTWQTFDIDFRAARFNDEGKKTEDARLTVRHNGVEVYNDLVIDHTTTASPERHETPERKPHYFQDHGHELHYRNVWIVEK